MPYITTFITAIIKIEREKGRENRVGKEAKKKKEYKREEKKEKKEEKRGRKDINEEGVKIEMRREGQTEER